MKNEERYDLKKQVTKRQRTIMIGALAKFELIFGFLWGDRTDGDVEDEIEDVIDRLTSKLDKDDLRLFATLWQDVRTSVLNGGNDQIRNTEKEFENYEIKAKRKYTNIPVRKGRRDED